MDKQIIWTKKAVRERKLIFEYWNNRNKSKAYSSKLYALFQLALKLIVKHPEIGKPTQVEKVRVKVALSALIVYEITDNSIIVLSLWDTRQNPNKLNI